jgi:hypothetical protein
MSNDSPPHHTEHLPVSNWLRRAGIAVFLSILLATGFAVAQPSGIAVRLTVDTSNSSYPLRLDFVSNNYKGIAAVRLVAKAPTTFAAFLSDTSKVAVVSLSETVVLLNAIPDTTGFPTGSGPIIRLLTDSTTRQQSFTVDYLNVNGQSVGTQDIEVSIGVKIPLPGPCDKQQLSLNTGVEANGSLTGIGLSDPFWTQCNAVPAGLPGTPSKVIQPSWLFVTNSASGWISYQSNNTQYGVGPPNNQGTTPVDYEYCRTFCVKDAQQALLHLEWAADDRATVHLNGMILPPITGGYNFWTTVNQTVNLNAGVNTLRIVVRNYVNPPSYTGLILRNSFIRTTPYFSLGLTSDNCCKPNSSICGHKYWDKNCNGQRDLGEPGLAGWTITLDQPSGPDLTTVTDANGAYCFLSLNAGNYTVKETLKPGWALGPSSGPFNVTLLANQAQKRDFLNCKQPTCEELFSDGENNEECCIGNFNVSNAGGATLQSLSFVATGGNVTSVYTGCPSSLTTPASYGAGGITAGTITFAPACASGTNVQYYATPTTATGIVCITWTGTFTIGTSSFKCTYKECIQCDPPATVCGKWLSVVPNIFLPDNLDWRRFTITNLKVPASNISSVDIKFTPEAIPHHTGGGLLVDGNILTPLWTYPNSGGPADAYTRIRMNCTGTVFTEGPAAANSVKFNLGVDNTTIPLHSGIVHIKIGYCDGDTCDTSYVWTPPASPVVTGSVLEKKVPPMARIFGLDITPVDSAASISISLQDTSVRILAITAPSPSPDREGGNLFDLNVQASRNTAVYTPASIAITNQGAKRSTIYVVYTSDDTARVQIPLVRYFNNNAQEIGHVSIPVTGTILSDVDIVMTKAIDIGMTLRVMPNPTNGNVAINLDLRNGEVVEVVITDLQGKEITTVVAEHALLSGSHAFMFSTSDLPNGSYIVTARTLDNRAISTQLKVLR